MAPIAFILIVNMQAGLVLLQRLVHDATKSICSKLCRDTLEQINMHLQHDSTVFVGHVLRSSKICNITCSLLVVTMSEGLQDHALTSGLSSTIKRMSHLRTGVTCSSTRLTMSA